MRVESEYLANRPNMWDLNFQGFAPQKRIALTDPEAMPKGRS